MNKYTREEVFKETLNYFSGDELATNVWIDKYCLKDSIGNLYELTPEDMHKRLAKEFSRIENSYNKTNKDNFNKLSDYGKKRTDLTFDKIFNYFNNFKYIVPQGSVMSILGDKNSVASLSNCVVLPEIFDSYGGLLFTDQQLTQLFKRRCGVGISISSLRPENTPVRNSAKSTTGAVSFMERFSNTTREVAQNSRRGALIITIDINHPDVEKFITIKKDLKKVTGANISVLISDEFMTAVKNNEDYTLKFPVNSDNPIITKVVKAKELWNLIISCATSSAEPGIIFWTKQHEYSTSSIYPEHRNISTNPCSEIAMDNDSCRLIALNMLSCVENPYTKNAYFNFDKWYEVTYEAQRLMDDLVDLELESVKSILEKIESDPEPDYIKQPEIITWQNLYKNGKKNRRTGLGFTALGDTLAALNFKYDSDDSLNIVEQIMKTKCKAEFDSSIDLSIERGCFEGFNQSIENTSKFVQMLKEELPEIYDRMMLYGRRNISISTVAPTGSLSLLTQTTSGIEPVFMLSYKRRKKLTSEEKIYDFIDDIGDKWKEFEIFHHGLKNWMTINNTEDCMLSPYYGCTASELNWKYRIMLQSIAQKYTTHSISSTINLKADTTEQTVGEIYFDAWEKGLKGITIYRDGSRSGVLVSKDTAKKDVEQIIKESNAPKRPKDLECDIIRFSNKGEKWIGFIGFLKDRPYEIFTGIQDAFPIPSYLEKGIIRKFKKVTEKNNEKIEEKRYDFVYTDKDGYEQEIKGLSRAFNEEYWDTAKMISAVLRHGMPIPSVINLLDSLHLDGELVGTWKAGVKRMLKKYVKDDDIKNLKMVKCPECGQITLVVQNSCVQCINPDCGWSKCE
jgi:ribonucleoside-diphosphate reductase alpha chain